MAVDDRRPMLPEHNIINTALHVIATERDALSNLETLYRTDTLAQKNMERAVAQLVQTIKRGGKLVICGVGKSGKIGRKLEATMNSVGIHSVFLHPTEALHGDLGMIRSIDTLLLISFSGRTAELLLMLPHIPRTVPVIAITSHTHPSTCPLLSYSTSEMAILLPAPLHIDEESSFALSAPTSSTTVALALGDALALATARNLHTLPGQGPAEVFKGFHPGGAIGAAAAASALSTPKSLSSCPSTTITSPSLSSLDGPTKLTLDETGKDPASIFELLIPIETIPTVGPSHTPPSPFPSPSSSSSSLSPSTTQIRILDVLLAAIQNPTAKSWVKLSPTHIIPPHRVRSMTQSSHGTLNVDTPLSELSEPAAISIDAWLPVRASSSIDDVRIWVEEAMAKTEAAAAAAAAAAAGSESCSSGISSLLVAVPVVISVVDDMDEDKILGFVSGDDVCSYSDLT